MTNEDKADLRRLCRAQDPRPDARLAMLCGCSIATVKKYRKSAQAMSASGQDPQGLEGVSPASAVGATDAPNPIEGN